ncbi:hypothetical protein [Methanosarcina barkeri]|uniref:hypothetical protein n=1 Tax=Methanosarcina barkeri TaxID=2208 RepID=UPI000A7E0C6B|nr:hypothetical protein [Methanosarcina barkeri]
MQLSLPHILVPFLVAAALQTVQGSRVATMLIAPSFFNALVSLTWVSYGNRYPFNGFQVLF